MDTASSLLRDRLLALEAENAALRSRLQSCEQSYAVLQAEVAALRQPETLPPAPVSAPGGDVARANDVLKRSLDLLSTDPDLDKFVGHVLMAIAHQFQSPLTEYWSQNDHTAYIEQLYWEGQILARGAIARVFPCHVGLAGFTVPPAMIDGVPLCQRKKPIIFHDHSTHPFTKDLPWVIQELVPRGLLKEINVPLFLGNTTIGALTIHVPYTYEFTADQVELAQALAHQVTLAAEMQRLAEQSKQVALAGEREQAALERVAEFAKANDALQYRKREVQRSYHLLSVVAQVTQDLLKNPNVEQAIAQALQQLGEVSGASRMTLFQEIPEPQTGRLQHQIMLEWTVPPVPRLSENPDTRSLYSDDYRAIASELYAGRSTSLHLRDFPTPAPAYWAKFGVESRSIVPILIEGAYFGCVCFDDCFQYHPWSAQEMDILTAGAGAIGAALLRQRLGERLMQARSDQERADELAHASAAMNRILTLTARETGLDSLLNSVLAAIAEQFDASLVEWWEKLSATTITRRLSYLDGQLLRAEDLIGQQGISPFNGNPIFEVCDPWAVESWPAYMLEEIEQIPDTANHTLDSFSETPDFACALHLQNPGFQKNCLNQCSNELKKNRAWYGIRGVLKSLNVPVVVEQRAIGALAILVPGHRSFTETQIQFASGMAQHLALAVLVSHRAEEARQTAIVREQERAAQERVAELAIVNEALTQRDCLLSVVAQVTQHLLENPNVEQAIEQALQHLGQAAGASRSNLLEQRQDVSTRRLQHHILREWTAPHIPRQIDDGATDIIINDDMASIIAELHAGRPVCLSLDEYPEKVKPLMAGLAIQVTGLAPIFIEGTYFGCLCLDNCVDGRLWSAQEMDVLMAGAGAIGAALLRQRLVDRLIRSQAEQQRAVELAKANDALKRSLNTIATDANPHQIIAHILKIVAEQFESPLVEYWTHSPGCHTAHLSLTYWQGKFLHPVDQPGHPGNTDFPCFPCLICSWSCDQNVDYPPYFLIEDITTDPYIQEASGQIGVDVGAWYNAHGVCQLLNIPLWLNEQTIGALDIWLPGDRSFSPAQIELAYTFGQQITLASYLNQLFEDAKQTVLFEERNRIASDIHDTLAQAFTGISLQLEVAKPLILQEPDTVEQILHHISELAKNGLAEARRSVWALYPPGGEYANLAQMLYDSVEQISRNTPISIEVNLLGSPCPLTPYLGMNLLRIGQEALTNALKHSQAQTVLIELTYTPDLVSLSIRDDGRGFTPPMNLDNLNGGFGLVGMYERCDRIGANLSIVSQPGQGTQILVESPLC